MKTKTKIIIGSALAIGAYFLWSRNKNKKTVIPSILSPDVPVNVPTGNVVDNSLFNPKTKAEQLAEEARVAEIAKSVKAFAENEARLLEEARVAKVEQQRLADLSLAEYRAEQQRLVEQGIIDERQRYLAEQERLNQERYSIPSAQKLEAIQQEIKTLVNPAYQEAVRPVDFIFQGWLDGERNTNFNPVDAV